MTNKWQGKKVLITGVCGTVGAELLKQLSKQNCSHIVGIDNLQGGASNQEFLKSLHVKNKDRFSFFVKNPPK